MTTWTDGAFVGGHRALDFVNTAGGATKERDTDRLPRFIDAADWAYAAGIVNRHERDQLARHTARDPVTAEQALRELRTQREALHGFLLAGIEGMPCSPSLRARVHADIATAYRDAELSEQFITHQAWIIDITDTEMRLLAHRLALSTGALLASGQRAHIAACGRCSWLFLDPSPTRRRRWCSMTTCGNRAKAERHQRQQ